MRRYDILAQVLATDNVLVRALTDATNAHLGSAQEVLAAFQERVGAEIVYLMNLDGRTIAAGNAGRPETAMQHDHHFRPYFQATITGERSHFVALGLISGQPTLSCWLACHLGIEHCWHCRGRVSAHRSGAGVDQHERPVSYCRPP